MNPYKITIIWRADDVSVSTKTGVKHEKQKTVYDAISHQFHQGGRVSITGPDDLTEYFNWDAIFSFKPSIPVTVTEPPTA